MSSMKQARRSMDRVLEQLESAWNSAEAARDALARHRSEHGDGSVEMGAASNKALDEGIQASIERLQGLCQILNQAIDENHDRESAQAKA